MDFIKNTVGVKAVERVFVFVQKAAAEGKWNKLFVENGRFLQEKYVLQEMPFQEELLKVFSSDSMLRLAEKLDQTDGFGFVESLYSSLSKLMSDYEIPETESEAYIQYFVELVLGEIRESYPELYEKCHFEQAIQEMKSLLHHHSMSLARIESKLEDKIDVYSPEEIDSSLKEKTTDPSIGLDFFVIDDIQFKRDFYRELQQTKIYVRGKGREKATYCILNELQHIGDPRPVIVVKTFESWEKLRKQVRGHILIPMFYENGIVAPEGNTTIFVYGETEPCTGHNVLELRPRTLSTIRNALRQAGVEENRIDKLIRDTHGLFVPMKKYLFNGRITNQPSWLDGLDDRIKRTALLIGKWNPRSKGDREVIESLSGLDYDSFMSAIAPYMKGEDPLVIRMKSFQGDYYSIASIEDAWELIDAGEDKTLFQRFLAEVQEVLGTPENWFSYSRQEMLEAQFKNETPHWSEEIRHGMLRTLIMWLCYKENTEYRGEIDQLIKTIFAEIRIADHWKYISRFMTELCEIAPKQILDILEKEFEQPTGLLDMMDEEIEDTFFDTDFGIHVIWGAETLLVQRKYVARAARFLARLDDHASGSRSRQLQDVFEKLLCTWFDFSALQTPEEKFELADDLLDVDEHMWDHVLKCLPSHHASFIGGLQKPLYREHAEPRSIARDVVFQTAEKYINLLLTSITDNTHRWEKLLQTSWEFGSDDRREMLQKLRELLPEMSDDDRLVIKETMQDKITQHRMYTEASWAVEEEVIREYEAVMEEISFDTPEYDYVVFFADNFRNYLLHPVPYHTEKFFEKNEELCQKYRKEAVERFQENDYNLKTLAGLCAGHHAGNVLGRSLADYWKPGVYQGTVMEKLYAAQNSGCMAADYIDRCAVRDPSIMPKVLTEVLGDGRYDPDFIARVYVTEAKCCGKNIPMIQCAPEELKRAFWKREFLSFPKETTKWALDECRQYGTVNSYVHLLYYSYLEKTVSEEELFDYLNGIDALNDPNPPGSIGLYLGDLLEPVQKRLLVDGENSKIMRIAQIEIFFYSILGWEKKRCFRYLLQKSPRLYLDMVECLYDEDGHASEKKCKEENDQRTENIYRLFTTVRFCPGERNGTVREDDLVEWTEGFKDGLIAINRGRLFGYLLGRVLANAPVGSDGYSPCEAVRKIIERYADESLKRAYRFEVYNQRGGYILTEGKAEQELAEAFQRNAEALRLKYPQTAAIYDGLSDMYRKDAKREREEAEYAE